MKAERTAKIDESLLTRSKGGDRAAREELARVCLPRVWRTVYLSCNGGPDVEDLVQTAMIQTLNDIGQFRGTGDFFRWLDRVTLNVVRQHFRRRYLKALLPSSDTLESAADTRGIPEDRQLESARLLRRLAHHLDHLRPKQRAAVVLSIVQGYTVSEIALITGTNVETAKKRLSRGRQDLVARVQRDPYCRQILKEMEI